MIKTDAQRKARTIEGKPVGDWFNSAAQRQKRDNQFASYDSPMRRPLPEAEKETKAEQKTEPKGAEKAEASTVTKRLAAPSAQAKGKAMGLSAIADARNEGIKASRKQNRTVLFPARPVESKRPSDSYVSKPGNKSVMSLPSGNKDVEAAKVKRVTDAKAKEERRKKDVAMNVGRTPYMPNKPRSFSL
jgi:hypothetical protein